MVGDLGEEQQRSDDCDYDKIMKIISAFDASHAIRSLIP